MRSLTKRAERKLKQLAIKTKTISMNSGYRYRKEAITVIIILLLLFFFSCSSSKPNYSDKIKFKLNEFTDDGMRKNSAGEYSSINYEFCIPAEEEAYKEVFKIDSTAAFYKGSKGRSACSDKEWLCIGSSRQPGFKKVIKKLAELPYIRQITETFWE